MDELWQPGLECPPSVEEMLARPPWGPSGVLVASYPAQLGEIRQEVMRALVQRGIAEPMPLETLHERVREEDKLPAQGLLGAPTIQTDPALRRAYRALIQFIAHEILHFDVVFEANPPLRFHFPMRMPDRFRSPDGRLLTHHSDLFGGDPFDQINGWLPLTHCRGTSTLQFVPFCESQHVLTEFAKRLEFDAAKLSESRSAFFDTLCTDPLLQGEVLRSSQPLDVEYGSVVLFDSRLLHATAENVESITRISIDFRLLPTVSYEVLARRWSAGARPSNSRWRNPLKGGFYDECSAYEL